MMTLHEWFRVQMAVAAVAVATVPVAWGQCPSDDLFEDNDTCGTAAALTAGVTSNLVVQGQANANGLDNDFWLIPGVPQGQVLTVDATFIHALGDIDLGIYEDAGCTVLADSSFSGDDNEQCVVVNSSGVARDYYVGVYAYGAGFDCNDYALQVSIAPDPCQMPGQDDGFEENDSCGASTILGPGTYTGLFVSVADPDHYAISVGAGQVLTVDQSYPSSPEMYVELHSEPTCMLFLTGIGWGGGSNSITWINDTGVATTVYLTCKVDSSQGGCSVYDLAVAIVQDPCQDPLSDDAFEQNDSCLTAAALGVGAYTGLFVSEQDEDFYAITVPAGDVLTVDQSYASAAVEVGMELYDDATCSSMVESASWGSGANSLSHSNGTGVAHTYYLRGYMVNGDCGNYDLTLSLAPDPCLQFGLDDGYEDNDFCWAGAALTAGTHTGLFITSSDLDYYQISVPAGEQLTVDQFYVPGAELVMHLYSDSSCTTFESASGWSGGHNTVTWANTTGSAATVYLSCDIDDFAANCINYDLQVTFSPDPCQDPSADDALEENDDCPNAVVLSDGTLTGLFVSEIDPDFYLVTVADGDSLSVDLAFSHSVADVDVYLYDGTGLCGSLATYLTRGNTSSDNEHITWTNLTGGVEEYYVMVVVSATSVGACNDYDMSIAGAGAVLATEFCLGDGTASIGGGAIGCPCGNESLLGAGEGCSSSLGFGAKLSVSGSSIVASDDLVFHISQARPNQPSLLIQGATPTALPFKDGILCAGNPTERVEVVSLDGNGAGSTSSSIVTEGNNSAGTTRYYQAWYRDPGGVSPCGSGSNFTQGLWLTWM